MLMRGLGVGSLDGAGPQRDQLIRGLGFSAPSTNLWEGWEGTPASMRTDAPVLRTLLDLALCTSTSSCTSAFLYNILYNKLVNVNKCFL